MWRATGCQDDLLGRENAGGISSIGWEVANANCLFVVAKQHLGDLAGRKKMVVGTRRDFLVVVDAGMAAGKGRGIEGGGQPEDACGQCD